MNFKRLMSEWKLWLLAILVIVTFLEIRPFMPTNGVLIEGVKSPAPNALRVGQVITKFNDFVINDLDDYYSVVNTLSNDSIIRIEYREEVMPYQFVTREAPYYLASEKEGNVLTGLVVGVPKSNRLDFGLEIVGGTKVLLTPESELTSVEAENLVEILRQRLNLFGLKEIPVNYVSDLSGNQYFRIEFAGASEDDVRMLLEREGVFEGRIGNDTAFTGSDIVSVCVSGVQCTMKVQQVYDSANNIFYMFEFQIDLSREAAERFANITKNLTVADCDQTGCYLSNNLDLYLDGELIQDGSLRLPESVQGEVLTSARISGSRSTMAEAQSEMKRLQAILQSRNLPVKLNLVSIESISPEAGEGFVNNIIIVFATAITIVALIIGLRYKSFKIAVPIIIIIIIEVISTLGIAVMIGWTLDLASIAGILASVGTCLDDQIIITDEILSGDKQEVKGSVKKRIKSAFLVIIIAFTTTLVSMVPLVFAGAGVLKGFAITTIIGISIGVLITRPAFGRLCELIYKD